MLHALVLTVLWLFPVSEMVLALRRRSAGSGATPQDQGSMAGLWITIGLAIMAATLLAYQHWLPLRLGRTGVESLTLGLMGSGLLLRWAAIRTLGKFFTVDVAIHPSHAVVQSGPYAWVRHPSYAGLLLAFLGLGFQFQDGFSLITLMAPITLVLWRRIRLEEEALRQSLGAPYEAYCLRTKRLIPGIL